MILEIKDLCVTYNKSTSPNDAVRGVSLSLADNSFSGLIGESGSGKSTIIMTLLGLLPGDSAASGEVLYLSLIHICTLADFTAYYTKGTDVSIEISVVTPSLGQKHPNFGHIN